ncbi:2'-deoxynucleoside 5'-phosphate N-hydrolase 1 isoform X2 [Anabas testudineus]|uniref:2'-deoxynucleoside 5'-phosphate N-hydrolase 1 isoform X2 n=1 Tax=Anabas testudineus TaxID=64144 RepID=UPI000E465AF0|nr:2'-deoxynucleoside 5'-phosphate N-hydrolase 1 isoform X2 [Anabas testudineus]
MKIYFCGSIRGGRDDVNIYRRLVEKLQSYGTVLTEHVSSSELTDRVVVAEVTQPSLGVGYELGRAVDMNKKILCLFRPSSGRTLSAMIRGADDGQLFVVRDYTEDEAENILEDFFSNIKRI